MMVTDSPEARLPMASVRMSLASMLPGWVGSLVWITQFRWAESGSGSLRLTPRAVPGPLLLTVMVNDTVPVELTVPLPVLVIVRLGAWTMSVAVTVTVLGVPLVSVAVAVLFSVAL